MASPSSASATQQWRQLLQDVKDKTFVLRPPEGASARPSALVLILPGALQASKNYLPIATAISEQGALEDGGVNVWVAVAGCSVAACMNALQSMDKEEKSGYVEQGFEPGTPSLSPMPSLTQLAISKERNSNGSQPLPRCRPCSDNALLEVLLEVLEVVGKTPGLELKQSAEGRYTNVAIAAHSMGGCLFQDVAHKTAGATILMEGAFNTQYTTKAAGQGWAASCRPIMILGGQRDGQMAWPSFHSDATISAWIASRQGAMYAATHKPVILIPGLNHGQVCSQQALLARGDCEPGAPAEVTLADAGRAMAAFVITHFGTKPEDDAYHRPSAEYLVEQAVQTAEFLEAYGVAMGVGSLVSAWESARDLDTQDSLRRPLTARQLSHSMSGASEKQLAVTEQLSLPVKYGPNIGVPLASGGVWGAAPSSATPLERAYAVGALSHGLAFVQAGTVTSAEMEVSGLQSLVAQQAVDLGVLPPSALDKLRVVTHLHTNYLSFVQSQPLLARTTGCGMLELQVHALIHFPVLEKTQAMDPASFYCVSHTLWAKLKDARSLAAEMRQLFNLPPLPASAYQSDNPMTARVFNEEVLQWALSVVPKDQLERYEEKSVKLVFEADEECPDAGTWACNSRMCFTPQLHTDEDSSAQSATGGSADGAQHVAPLGRAVVSVRSPVFRLDHQAVSQVEGGEGGDAPLLPPQDKEERRFWGAFYAKVMSRAQAVEWIQLGSIRQSTLPEAAGCRWGGHTVPAECAPWA